MPDVTSSLFEDNVLKISGTGGASVANKATGTYGALTVTAAGLWTYTPAPAKIAALAFGSTFTENITLDAKTFAFTIYGTNDEAKVGGTKTATVLEDTGSGVIVVSGALTVTDPDSGESSFRGILSAGMIVNSLVKTYGTFSFNPDTKIWKYTYDTNTLKVLGAKDAPVETITIVTKDGSTATVTVNIKGANDVATITGTVTATLTEDLNVTDGTDGTGDDILNVVSINAGVVDIATASPPKAGFLHASGDLGISGNDTSDSKFTAGVTSKTYGIFAIDEDGNWTYDAANNSSALQALTDGSTKVESIVVKSKDGLNSTTVAITIKGVSNSTEGGAGSVTESNAKDTAVSGTLTVLDNGSALSLANRPADITVAAHSGTAATAGGASGAYGLFTYTASTNKWTYTLNSQLAAVDNLKTNESLTDTLTVAGKDVIVVIKGLDDLAQFSGNLTGSITEDGATSSAGILQTTGNLDAAFNYTPTNPIHDDNATEFLAASTSKTNGIFSVDATGAWTYRTLANAAPLQKLAAGATLTESFIVKTADGKASTTVTLTLNGSATSSEGAQGTVTESNSAATSTVSGTLSVLDTAVAVVVADRPADLANSGGAELIAATSGGASGAYGVFTYTASTNKWIYVLDNTKPAVTALALGATLVDSLVFGTGEKVDVVIKGVNDVATIAAIAPVSGATVLGVDTITTAITITLTEDTLADIDTGAVTGNLQATGKLTATDADTGEAAFVAQSVSDSVGVFTLESDGDWTYVAANKNATIQKLTSATTSLLTRNYTAKTIDGVTKAITVKIQGASNSTFDYAAVALDADITNTVSGQLKNLDGTLTVTAGAYSHAVTTYGKLIMGSDGKFVYHLGNDNFTNGDTETVTVTVGATTTDIIITLNKSDLPNVVTGNTSGTLTLDADSITAPVTGDLNAVDPDDESSESLSTSAYTSPSYGTVTLLANGNWSYQVDDANATLKALTSTQSITDTFIVESDSAVAEGSTTVSIVITGKKDAPVGVANTNAVEEDATITSTVSVLVNDTDVDTGQQATLSVSFAKKTGGVDTAITTGGTAVTGVYGTLTIKANGTYTYKADLPASDLLATAATANDVFVYTVKDSDGETHTANLTITVTGKEDGSAVEATAGDDLITATANDETIDGLAGDDVIDGGDGSDTLSGGAGNDEIDGQGDNDTIKGGDGADTLVGGAGNDNVDGEAGADTITDSAGTNTLKGGAGADIITGGTGVDTIEGGADNDKIDGGAGNDSIKGEAGDDLIIYGSGDTLVDGGSGTDTLRIVGDATVDLTSVFVNFERIEGKSSDVDAEAATNNAQTVTVNSTNLTTVTYIDLGAGTDVLQVSGTVDLSLLKTLSGVETIQGLSSVDTITGTANADSIKGGAEDDTIDGGAAQDTLLGEAGDDTFIWSAGDDTITGGETSEDAGGDILKVSGTVDISGGTITEVEKLLGALTLTDTVTIKGTEGFTTIDLGTATGTATDTLIFDLGALDLTGVTLTGVENIKGVVADNTADTLTLAGTTTLDTLKLIDLGSNTDTLKISASVDLSAVTLTSVETLNGDGAVANEVVTLTVNTGNATLGSLTTLDLGGGTADELKAQGTFSLAAATVSNIEKLTGLVATTDTFTIKGTEGFTTIDLKGGDSDTLIVTAATVTFAGVTLTDVDVIKGNSTVQTITGSSGNDTFEITANVTIDGGAGGTDAVKGTSSNDFIYLDKITNVDSIDALDATGDEDVLIVGSASSLTGVTISNFEKIEGTSAADNFTIDATALGIISAAGITSIDLKANTDKIIVSGVTAVDFSAFTFLNVESIQGNVDANTITGTSGVDVIKGGAGNDILIWDTDDTFDGEADADTLKGTAGDDSIVLSQLTAIETIDGLGDTADDTLIVSGTATLAGITLANVELIEGLSGNDDLTLNTVAALGAVTSIDLKAGTNSVIVSGTASFASIAVTATGGTVTIQGGAAADTITGTSGADTIKGGADADTIVGGTGADTLYGEAGNDIFTWDSGDTYIGGADADTLNGTAGVDSIVLAQLTGIETIDGGASSDKLIVSGTVSLSGITLTTLESIEGTSGVDTLTIASVAALGTVTAIDLLAGANIVNVDGTFDLTAIAVTATGGTVTIQGGANADTITGGSSADTIKGGANADTIVGGGGIDTLYGEAGNDNFTWDSADTYYGGDDADTLTGTAGDDTFALDKINTIETIVSGGGTDTISFSGVASLSGITLSGFGASLTLAGSGSDDTLTLNTAALAGFTTVTITGGAHSSGDIIDLVGNLNLSSYNISQFEKITGTDNATHVVTLGVSGLNSTFGDFTHVTLGTDVADELVVQGTLDMSGKTISGVEKLTGSASDDTLTIKGSEGYTTIALGAGVNTLTIADNAASLATAVTFTGVTLVKFENDVLTFTGSATSTTYEWNANLTTLTAGVGGADSVVGTSGNDTVVMAALVNVETVDGKEGTGDALVIDGSITATISNFEVLTGGANADTVTLTAAQLAAFTSIDLNGNSTDKIVASGAGTFNLSNVVDVELVDGTVAQQTILIGTTSGYTIDGKGGNDTITGGDGNDTITYYVGDIVDGGNGDNTLLVSGTATVTLTGTSNIDTVQGNSENNVIVGTSTADTIKGGAGVDTLSGGSGIDALWGEAGNDILIFSAGDTFEGGADSDTLRISTTVTLGNLLSVTLNDVETIDVEDTGATNHTLIVKDANLDDVTSIDLGGGTDTLQVSGTVDLSGLTLLVADNITGTTGVDTLTIKDATLDAVTSIDLGTGANVLKISGSVDLVTTTLANVATLTADGSANNETLTLRVDTGNSTLDTLTSIDLGNGTTDALVVSGTINLSAATIANVEQLTGTVGAEIITVDDSCDDFSIINLGGGTDELIFSGSLNLSTKTLLQTEKLTGDANANVVTLSVVGGNSTLGSLTDIDLNGNVADEVIVQGAVDLTGANFLEVYKLSGGATDEVVTINYDDVTATNFVTVNLSTGTDILVVKGNGAGAAVDISTATVTTDLIRFTNLTGGSVVTGTAGNQTYEWNTLFTSITGSAGSTVQGTASADTIDFTKITTIANINGLDGVDVLSIAGGTSLAAVTLTNVETIDSSAAAVLTLASVPNGVSTIDLTTGASDLTLSAAVAYDFSNVDLVGVDDLTAAAGSTVTVKNLSSADVTEFIGGGAYTLVLSGTSNLTGVTISATVPTITGSTGADIITLNDAGITINAGNGVDVVTGGTGADIITGGDGADSLIGAAGTDTLDGGGDDNDADTLSGGADADTLNFYTSDLVDSFDGGAASDTLVFMEDAGSGATDFALSSINMTSIDILDTRGGGIDVFLAIDSNVQTANLLVNCNATDEITIDNGTAYTADAVFTNEFSGFTITIDFA